MRAKSRARLITNEIFNTGLKHYFFILIAILIACLLEYVVLIQQQGQKTVVPCRTPWRSLFQREPAEKGNF